MNTTHTASPDADRAFSDMYRNSKLRIAIYQRLVILRDTQGEIITDPTWSATRIRDRIVKLAKDIAQYPPTEDYSAGAFIRINKIITEAVPGISFRSVNDIMSAIWDCADTLRHDTDFPIQGGMK